MKKKLEKTISPEAEELLAPEETAAEAKPGGAKGFLKILGRVCLVLLETVILLVMALYGVMYVVAKGPSETARDIFVMSVRETSAIGFIANIFFTDEEIAQIEANRFTNEYVPTDTSLIDINTEIVDGADAWGLVDEDGDGIIVERITGEGYNGYMMVVLDPSRVIMGSKPESFMKRGYTVAEMVEEFGAVAGINAGGFYDPGGQGDGSLPDSLVVVDGEIYCPEYGTRQGFVGIDYDNIMHVGTMTVDDVRNSNIRWGVCFGPVLIQNGVPVEESSLASGVNPRTAIGQRSDGAILMLVIDGRQVMSLGAKYSDLMKIMLEYGAVNAMNLDGGSSSLMWFEGDYINNCASVVGIRPVPTTFLVLPEGVSYGE